MQELMTYAGQLNCYENCTEILKEFINVEVSAAQVYRVTDTYGEQIGKEIENTACTLTPVRKDDVLYAALDGSMIFIRKKGWKETKLGRLFKASDSIRVDGKQGYISHSQYLAHLGDCKTFADKMEDLIALYGELGDHLVFLSDGAPWIKNWIADAFPNAISILDYFHASEHLYTFTESYFKDKEVAKEWAKEQQTLLLESQIIKVIENIKTLAGTDNEAAENLIAYYQSNIERMDYKRYKQIGCGIIGSGAIESAHRTVIQERMKKSGQRWSEDGAQNMLNLRVTKMNGQWSQIIKLVKTNFKAAA
jgi:hypothetical protein